MGSPLTFEATLTDKRQFEVLDAHHLFCNVCHADFALRELKHRSKTEAIDERHLSKSISCTLLELIADQHLHVN